MKLADKLRRSTITLLTLSLCVAALTNTARGQTAGETPQASENIDMSVMIGQEGDDFFFITENLDISFVNATSPQLTRKTPLLLILNSSSPPYTGLTEEKAQITDLNDETTLTNLIYNLTGPVDDVSILFNVATENNPNSIPTIIIAFSAVCIVLIDVFVFVRTRRRKLVQPESRENSK